ncbi:OmpP1/FadL family transporter [Salinimonas chungwhensis]|uniref:OmpP1/FadL family transporter n=1 Tax=Salinimonas chungwhensis TaxID=265425 RepID=UPI000362E113|nr:outer membrane protein transport protein [Salinimonas chungwhensis]
MHKHSKLFLSVGLAVSCISSTAIAAGFQVNEHSANGLGRAFAGQAATPENATILTTNAAAITQFDTQQISVAVSYIDPNVDISGEINTQVASPAGTVDLPAMDGSEQNIADTAIIPAAYYIRPINDKLSFGIGAFTSYGLRTDYSDDYNALHFADDAEVKSVTLNPTLAYKVTDTLSLGLGISTTYAEAEISTSTPKAIETISGGMVPGNATIVGLEGDDWGFGWNVGVFWQPTSTTDVGLSYRAETKLELQGEVSSALRPDLNQGGQLDLNLAAITELAVNQRLTEQWSVQASVVLTDWSTFEKLEANLDDGTDLLLKQENFDDTWRGSLGVTYKVDDVWTLRAGYAYDDGAVTTENRSLSIPDTDRHWITGGVSYAIDDSSTVDFGYAYLNGREADVDKSSDRLQALGVTSTITGRQSANAHILSAQYNLSF